MLILSTQEHFSDDLAETSVTPLIVRIDLADLTDWACFSSSFTTRSFELGRKGWTYHNRGLVFSQGNMSNCTLLLEPPKKFSRMLIFKQESKSGNVKSQTLFFVLLWILRAFCYFSCECWNQLINFHQITHLDID